MSQLAILGGAPLRTEPWQSWPILGPEEEQAVLFAIRARKLWYGEKVKEFEAAYAQFQDAVYGVSCTNGTTAIEISLIASGIGAGDEVITTPFTFMATASAILKANAVPVFADVDPVTGNLDPDAVERCITPQTRAVLPVHVAGLPVDIDRFEEIGRRRNLLIIYDAAHGWGTIWRGKGVGAYGAYNTYSFQNSKHITAGEGGMILTNDAERAERARSLTNCGRLSTGEWYQHFLLGSNQRMTEIQAAILLVQLSRLEEQTLTRMRNASWLARQVKTLPGLGTIPDDPRVSRRSWHAFQIQYNKSAWNNLPRERFLQALQAEGVRIRQTWPLLYRMPLFASYTRQGPKACPISCPHHQGPVQDYGRLRLPHAEALADETGVWVHHTWLLGDGSDVRDLFDAMVKVRENLDELTRAWQNGSLPAPTSKE